MWNECRMSLGPYTTISPQSLGMYLLSHVKPRSTIDAVELNFCVRNGNRCTLHAIHTKTLRRNLVYLQFSPLELRLNVLFTSLYEIFFFAYSTMTLRAFPLYVSSFYSYQRTNVRVRIKSIYKYRSCY